MKFTLSCAILITALDCLEDALNPASVLPHWAHWALTVIWVCIFVDLAANYRLVRK